MTVFHGTHSAGVRTYQQQFPPSVGFSQSVCSYSHVKQAQDDQLSGSVPPSLPSSFTPSARAVCCHLTQTSTCLPPDRTAATQHCSSAYLTSADVTQHAHITARPSLRLFVRPLGRRPATTGSVRDLRQRHLSPRALPPALFDLLLLHPSFSPFLNLLRSLALNPQRGRVQSVPQSKWLDIIMTLKKTSYPPLSSHRPSAVRVQVNVFVVFFSWCSRLLSRNSPE